MNAVLLDPGGGDAKMNVEMNANAEMNAMNADKIKKTSGKPFFVSVLHRRLSAANLIF